MLAHLWPRKPCSRNCPINQLQDHASRCNIQILALSAAPHCQRLLMKTDCLSRISLAQVTRFTTFTCLKDDVLPSRRRSLGRLVPRRALRLLLNNAFLVDHPINWYVKGTLCKHSSKLFAISLRETFRWSPRSKTSHRR